MTCDYLLSLRPWNIFSTYTNELCYCCDWMLTERKLRGGFFRSTSLSPDITDLSLPYPDVTGSVIASPGCNWYPRKSRYIESANLFLRVSPTLTAFHWHFFIRHCMRTHRWPLGLVSSDIVIRTLLSFVFLLLPRERKQTMTMCKCAVHPAPDVTDRRNSSKMRHDSVYIESHKEF